MQKISDGKCNFGLNCKYEHRCTICSKYGDLAHICRRRIDQPHNSGEHSSPRSPRGSSSSRNHRRSDRYHYFRSAEGKKDKDKA